MELPLTFTPGKPNPGAGVRSNDGARFSFDTPGRYNFGIWVPAFKVAKLANEDVVLTDTAVAAWTAAITTGLSSIPPTDGNGFDVGAVLYGKYAYRK